MHCRYCGAEMSKREIKCPVCGSTAKVAGCEDWGEKNARRTMILDGEKVSYRVHGHEGSGDNGCSTGAGSSKFNEYIPGQEQRSLWRRVL